MSLGLAEKEIYRRSSSRPLLYLAKKPGASYADRPVFYNNSGLFYIFILIILLACIGVLLNIGLKVQNINYEKEIYKINEMISLEKERSDRLLLEISSLKSPSRILEVAGEELNMEMEKDIKLISVSENGLEDNEKILDYILRENTASAANAGYDNLLGTIYYMQDIVLVVSESVLTFFIP
ncbi:MAG: cell division protein FtsL [Actinobacteria bacterium]|nr:cell division protein FtsL [Actinomycetota bacterium]